VDAYRDTEGLEFDDCGYVRTGPFADPLSVTIAPAAEAVSDHRLSFAIWDRREPRPRPLWLAYELLRVSPVTEQTAEVVITAHT
jgi:hypothetical protein